MFYINTLLNRPEKEINDLNTIKSNIEEYFVQVKDEKQLLSIGNSLDFDYLNGAIILKHLDEFLLNVDCWDLVDQLWAYILNVTESLISTGEGETYFPDQPVKLKLKSISKDLVLYVLEADYRTKVVLPKKDLIDILLSGAADFFHAMEKTFKGKCNYQYEIQKISSLRDTLLDM
ncbi:hypothetical protein [Fictibacillus fluitans]|uniref:Heme NO-binding domain-containing protein n=1 Tax=Fictibacillus fluitans TaxID=3058422 RepID=A0ABT8HZF3_9BACL|nr:hypothetical protein [Fictibacillus sp. NE201]MDN4526131.1 hypothetical protein [Fictibacillus sp. NE201]